MNITITEEGSTVTAVFAGRLDTQAAQQITETVDRWCRMRVVPYVRPVFKMTKLVDVFNIID